MIELPETNQIFERPNLEKSLGILKDAISKHKSIIILGLCKVKYEGRARSTLEVGERIIIIKEDGAVLIHRPKGYEPVNWQPSGCRFRTTLNSGILCLNAFRSNPNESLRILFDKISIIVVAKLQDLARFDLHVSEKEMQEAILLKPEILEDGFKNIAYEKKIEPGFMDIYGLDCSQRFVVVEIKRGKAGKSAVLQLAKYVEDVKNTLNKDVRGILAAPQISKGIQRLLATLNLEFKKIDPEQCARIIDLTQDKKLKDFF